MGVIKFTLKLILFLVWLALALAWMVFFGAIGVAACATVLLVPMGLMSFGLATMPLFASLAFMGLRRPAQQVVIVNR